MVYTLTKWMKKANPCQAGFTLIRMDLRAGVGDRSCLLLVILHFALFFDGQFWFLAFFFSCFIFTCHIGPPFKIEININYSRKLADRLIPAHTAGARALEGFEADPRSHELRQALLRSEERPNLQAQANCAAAVIGGAQR